LLELFTKNFTIKPFVVRRNALLDRVHNPEKPETVTTVSDVTGPVW
jgi:hypothetical protein